MVAICNNLSFGKVNKESDIDFFVVARRGHLFTVRILLTIFFQVMGVRRHGEKEAGRFCLSFFIDDTVLDFKQIAIEDDFYLSLWLTNLKPVIDDGVSADFLAANHWVWSHFDQQTSVDVSRKKWRPVDIFTWLFPSFFEQWMKHWQLKRARQKARSAGPESSLVVTPHMLKFHNIDRRAYYRDRWKERFGQKKLDLQDFFSF